MQKYHKIVSLGLSIGFVILVQVFATPIPVFRFLVPAFIGFLLVVAFYNYIYLNRTGRYSIWIWLRFLLFAGSWFIMFFLIPSSGLRGLFLLFGILVMYVFESMVGLMGEQMLFNETLLTAFGFIMSLFALAWYFPISSILYLGLIFLMITLLARSSFASTPASNDQQLIGSIVIGLLTAQAFWALSFLPLHFSALALILFSIFYFLWVLFYYDLFKHLTVRKVQFHLAVSLGIIVLILLVTPWGIIK